jgi:hypothetical protein
MVKVKRVTETNLQHVGLVVGELNAALQQLFQSGPHSCTLGSRRLHGPKAFAARPSVQY